MSTTTLNEQVLTGQSADETTSAAIYTLPYERVRLFVKFGAGTSAGVVTFETSPDPSYAGVWLLLGSATWAVASALGATTAGATVVGVFPYVRARISDAIVGGTVDVYIVGN